MKKAIISIAVIVLIAGAAFAARPKTVEFSGRTCYVVNRSGNNSVSSKKIPGAEVSVITSQGDTLRTVSDEMATFVFPKIPGGPATFKIEAEGYKTSIQIMEIDAEREKPYFKLFYLEKAEEQPKQ